MPTAPTAVVVGVGLIGGSVAAALRETGWFVIGVDSNAERLADAVSRGIVDEAGQIGPCDLGIVATPVQAAAPAVEALLAADARVVTDVGSVKGPVARAITSPRFVPGHPMAGSEQEGLAGAHGGLFSGATWVLTPTETTDDLLVTEIRTLISGFGAQVMVLEPERHDALVAMVSHVPHLTAATLMRMADNRSSEHRALLRLAAGGFRDMTRIASGHPAIWPGICAENRDAIVAVLDDLIAELGDLRSAVGTGDQPALLGVLQQARMARQNLPTTALQPDQLAEIRIPVRDEKGQLAIVATMAAALDVNIYDIEIAHSAEGPRGVIIVVVDVEAAPQLVSGLVEQGYRPSTRSLH